MQDGITADHEQQFNFWTSNTSALPNNIIYNLPIMSVYYMNNF